MASPLAAGIGAGGNLLGQLLDNWFEFEQEKRKQILDAKNKGFESEKSATGQLYSGQSDALGKLLASYGKSLL